MTNQRISNLLLIIPTRDCYTHLDGGSYAYREIARPSFSKAKRKYSYYPALSIYQSFFIRFGSNVSPIVK